MPARLFWWERKMTHGDCVNYRDLNKNTVKNKFLILVMVDLLDELQGSSIFSKINLRANYNIQVCMDLDDMYKTTFKTYRGQYEYLVKPLVYKRPSHISRFSKFSFCPTLLEEISFGFF